LLYLYVLTVLLILLSFFKDKEKTIKGIKLGFKKFKKILPSYLKLLIIISIVLLFSQDLIIEYLTNNNLLLGTILAVVIGSLTIMPGFIAYPLAGVLLAKGVPYMILGGFVTSLMLVGVVTYPLEKEYFGKRATIIRNSFSFFISLGIAIGIGFFYGEI